MALGSWCGPSLDVSPMRACNRWFSYSWCTSIFEGKFGPVNYCSFFIVFENISALDHHLEGLISALTQRFHGCIIVVFLAVITSIFFPCRCLLRLSVFERITLRTTKPNTNLKSQIEFSKALLSVYTCTS